MTEHDIIQALGAHLYLKYICIPNVLMFGDNRSEYEADFIYFKHNQRFLTEVEAKTNIEDFKRDFNKKRYHDHKHVKYFYYAMPIEMYEKHRQFVDSKLNEVGAGLILIDGIDTWDFRGNLYCVGKYAKRAKIRKSHQEMTEEEYLRYLRIGCMKWVRMY